MKTMGPCANVLLALLVPPLLATPLRAQQEALRSEIAQYVSAAYQSGDFHGVVLVADNGDVVYESSRGSANYEWDVENTLDTRFRIGSITKQFTALLIFQLWEAGELSLDDTISEHLAYYRQDTGGQVTIAQLLNHRSGIPDLTDEFSQQFERNAYTTREFVELFCSGDLRFTPGEDFHYSNPGYYILGAILEQVTGRAYGELLRERIFDPLGMTSSAYVNDLRVLERRAAGYRRGESDGGPIMKAALLDPSVAFSFGGIHSTARDLYRWDRALYTDQLLSEESRRMLFTPAEDETYANGWIVYPLEVPGEDRTITVTMHQGSINGYSGVILRNLETQDLVVILNNLASNGSEWRMGEELMLKL